MPWYRTLAAIVLVFAVALDASAATPASDELGGITRLYEQRQYDKALQELDAYLKNQPKDARGRFLKGLLLSEMGRTDDAIAIFIDLGNDFPNIAEPFNNLAVLYAAQGKFDDARAALEAAVRRNPSYSTAQENLGDVYTRLALRAYESAGRQTNASPALKQKVMQLRDFTSRIDQENAPAAPAPKAAVKPPAPRPEVAAAPSSAPAAPAPAPSTITKSPVTSPAASTATPPAAAAAAGGEREVLSMVASWAQSWASNDVAGYLGAYAPDFKVPAGMSRGAWETQRKQRIAKPRQIQLEIDNPKVTLSGDATATVVFRQRYKSGNIDTTDTKTLAVRRVDGAWKIVEETTGN